MYVLALISELITVYVSGVWAGVENIREQEKLEARKILENGDESHISTARFVVLPLTLKQSLIIG
ncbi:MAG: hypothetical protein HN916_03545 [Anaerolineae bacterium]|jgi:hypothetical protein|nr:hypothetical protein [Anaerolineae bacterium]